jgi:branched-chain amino acid transport system permease protein
MVYGVLRLINFAHGDVYMVGAVSGYYRPLDEPPQRAGTDAGGGLCGSDPDLLGAGILIGISPIGPARPRLVVLITAIGVSLLLENLAQLGIFFGPTPRQYPSRLKPRGHAVFRWFGHLTHLRRHPQPRHLHRPDGPAHLGHPQNRTGLAPRFPTASTPPP